MPQRRDIDPLEMPPRLLPHLQIVEVVAGGRLRFRLVGTAIVDAMGRESTGRYVDDTYDRAHRRFLDRLYGTVLQLGRPVYGSSWQSNAKGADLGLHVLATPLSENGHDANMILSATTFRFAKPGRRLAYPAEDLATLEDDLVEVL